MKDTRSNAMTSAAKMSLAASGRLAERTLADRAARLREVVVATDGSGDATSIAEALAQVDAGARISVRDGTYPGGFLLDKDVEIVGDVRWQRIGDQALPQYPVVLVTPDDPIRVTAKSAQVRRLALVDSGLDDARRRATAPPDRSPPEEDDDWQPATYEDRARTIVIVTAGSTRFESIILKGDLAAILAEGARATPILVDVAAWQYTWSGFAATSGARPTINRCVLDDLQFNGDGTRGRCQNSTLGFVYVTDGARPTIEDCYITGVDEAGVIVEGYGSNPLFRRNTIGRVFNDYPASVTVRGSAAPRFIENELAGVSYSNSAIVVEGTGTRPLFRNNVIRSPKMVESLFSVIHPNGQPKDQPTVAVADGARPRFSGNELEGSLVATGQNTVLVARDPGDMGGAQPVLLDGARMVYGNN